MPTDVGHLSNFDLSNVCINGKCLTWGVTMSLRTIFNLEQCVYVRKNWITVWLLVLPGAGCGADPIIVGACRAAGCRWVLCKRDTPIAEVMKNGISINQTF